MFKRYAIYFTPEGALANTGAAWLGWDVAEGVPVTHSQVAGMDLATLTQTPRKYGFHGTLKPPFVLRMGTTAEQLREELEAFCGAKRAVTLEGLQVRRLGRFFAIIPVGDVSALKQLAADIVRGFDAFRAAPSEAELERRRAANLTEAQEGYLAAWGYPYVMKEFRFHLTLTGRVQNGDAIAEAVEAHFAPVLPAPFVIGHLTLAGERSDGMFQEITRVPLRS